MIFLNKQNYWIFEIFFNWIVKDLPQYFDLIY